MTQTALIPAVYYPDVRDQVVYDPSGPRPQFLVDGEKLKALVVGLDPGQELPAHPETLAIYHILAGTGVMIVNGEEFAVMAGATIIAPPGASRGIRATSRLSFLAAKAGA